MREEIELMQIIRVPPMGRLIIQINNQRYNSLSEIEDERLKRRIITAIGELMGLAGGYQSLVNEGVAPPLDAQTPTGSLQQKAASLKEQQERFLEQIEQKKAQINTDLQLKKRKGKKTQASINPAPQPESLIEQIDAYLQTYKNNIPALQNRSIHLVNSPQGDVKIEVDGTIYNRPKDIDEIEIQRAIKTAIKEWDSPK